MLFVSLSYCSLRIRSCSRYGSSVTLQEQENLGSAGLGLSRLPTSLSTNMAAPLAPQYASSKQAKLIAAGQAFVLFVIALDCTILTTALPAVADGLKANSTSTFWIVGAYLLSSATFQPLAAPLADIYGMRWTSFTAVFLFTVGTLICCLSRSFTPFIVGRCIQGAGGGSMLALEAVVLSDVLPPSQRAKYIGYIQLVFSLGTNMAPILGGLIADRTTWRWM